MAYQYRVFEGGFSPNVASSAGDDLAAAIVAGMNEVAIDVTRDVAQFPPGDWEVVSHHALQLEDRILVTFLVRRETPPEITGM